MTPTLTAEQIGELEALLAKATPAPWAPDKYHCYIFGPKSAMVADSELGEADAVEGVPIIRARGVGGQLPINDNMDLIAALRNAAPALIAMAKQVIDHDSPAWDANERLNDTVEELIERAEEANEDLTAAYLAGYHKREAEVKSLRARLQSTESAMGRAMELGSEWRKEAAELRAQMMVDQGQYVDSAAKIEEIRRPYGSDDRMSQTAETPRAREAETINTVTEVERRCRTCAHAGGRALSDTCEPCLWRHDLPNWTHSTTDKGEMP